MKKAVVIALFAFFVFNVTGQTKTTKTSVYFPKDKYALTGEQTEIADTLIAFLRGKEIVRISIKGNTDSDADSLYNLELSRKRAISIKEYFEQKGIPSDVFKTDFYGEAKPIAPNISDEGKQKNRRVDIVVVYKEKTIIATETKVDSAGIKQDSCTKDTLIFLPQGSRYYINVCEYLKYKDCIKIEEFLTPQSILESGFSTETNLGEQLITGGMFRFDLCTDSQLAKPIVIKFRIPVPFNGRIGYNDSCSSEKNYKDMTLWYWLSGRGWRRDDSKVKTVRSNDSLFYEFTVNGSSILNLDYVLKFAKKAFSKVRTKIISTGDIRLSDVRILYPTPMTMFRQQPKRRENKVKFTLPCCPSAACGCIYLRAEGVDQAGDTLFVLKCLKDFEKKILFGKCKSSSEKIELRLLGFIPIWEKRIYRKYYIKPEDWTKKE